MAGKEYHTGWQRLTGIFLLIYFIGHVYETSSLTGGLDAWNAMLQLTQTPWGHTFLLLVIGTRTFHSVNGIRLIFTEAGRGIGKAGRPDYPYKAVSLNYRQKSGIWVSLILATLVCYMELVSYLAENRSIHCSS